MKIPWYFGVHALHAGYIYYGNGNQPRAHNRLYGDGRMSSGYTHYGSDDRMITTRYREKWTDSGDGTDEWLASSMHRCALPRTHRHRRPHRGHSHAALGDRSMQVSHTRRMLWRKPSQVNSLRRLGRARFKTVTDIYCERNRLEPKVDGWGRTGPRVSWSFDIHYPAYAITTSLA